MALPSGNIKLKGISPKDQPGLLMRTSVCANIVKNNVSADHPQNTVQNFSYRLTTNRIRER